MMRPRLKWSTTLTGVGVILVALACLWLWSARPSPYAVARKTPLRSMAVQAQGSTLAPVSVAGAVSRMRATSKSYKQQFQSARDYWALAKSILPAAKAGDPDAQFYLYQIDRACHVPRAALIAPHGTLVSLDEALQSAASWGVRVKPEEVQALYEQCGHFYENDRSELGSPRDWLQRATDGGQPIAQATTASLRLLQDQQKLMTKAGQPPMGDASLPPIGGDTDPRDLIRMAVESKDPEVLSLISSLQSMLHPESSADQRNLDSLAWQYIACQRGLDCSYYGDPVPLPCAASSANCATVPARLMSWSNNNWAPVQDRVQEISHELDAGQWDQALGLAPASDQ